MADRSLIEWTDTTWQIVTGCSVVSPGCTNCYAMKLAGSRLRNHPSRVGLTVASKAGPVWNGQVRFNAEWLTQPLRWTRPRRIFVAAHGDLFHEGVTDDQLDQIFAVMALCPRHVFQILTKRPERMRAYLADPARRQAAIAAVEQVLPLRPYNGNGQKQRALADQRRTRERWQVARERLAGCYLPNVWLGVSVEDQARADERIPVLLDTPAAVRWISAEPLLGPVDLNHLLPYRDAEPGNEGTRRGDAPRAVTSGQAGASPDVAGLAPRPSLDWVVAGGESGPGARPMHPDWARQLRDQCATAGVPFLLKQWGAFRPSETTDDPDEAYSMAWPDGLVGGGAATLNGGRGTPLSLVGKKAAGRLLDGVLHDGFPGARP